MKRSIHIAVILAFVLFLSMIMPQETTAVGGGVSASSGLDPYFVTEGNTFTVNTTVRGTGGPLSVTITLTLPPQLQQQTFIPNPITGPEGVDVHTEYEILVLPGTPVGQYCLTVTFDFDTPMNTTFNHDHCIEVVPVDVLTEAPTLHKDGRLNYRVMRAPIAVFMDADGSVEVWQTDPLNLYAADTLVISADAEAIAIALEAAEESGHQVLIAGYVDGVALFAKPDGSLKAEVLGVYGFEFTPGGDLGWGWGL